MKNVENYKDAYEELATIQGSGNRIRALRQLRGMSLEKLASVIEVNGKQYVYKLENQNTISLNMAFRLAAALDTSKEYLLCQTDNPKKKLSKKYIFGRIKEIHSQIQDLNNELSQLLSILEEDIKDIEN